MEVVNTEQELKWDLEKIKEYLKRFNTLKDFYRDPNYTKIYAWINNRRNRTGDQTLYLKNLLSELIEKDNKQTTEKLKELFPDFNFENVTYDKDIRHHKTIKGLVCEKIDKEGVVHGELDETRLDTLTQNSCKKCFSESIRDKYPQDLEFKVKQFLSTVPKDSPLIFSQNIDDFYLVPRFEGSTQNYLVVKNIKCTNHENPTNLYPDGARAIYKGYLEYACDNKKEYRGESTMRGLLELSGYTVEKNKKIGEYSVKGRGKRNRLKADAYFVKEDGTVVIAEFDGRQHFGPNEKHGGEEGFASTVLNDKAKNKYCNENGIKLIRISFNDERNISSELEKALSMNPMKDLYLSTNYPPKGWNNPDLHTIPVQIIESKSKKEYIITEAQLQRIIESQHELLSESSLMDRLKRRVNKESFKKYILETQNEFPDICGDFVDEYEYSDSIIAMAIEHFFAVNEDYFTESSYEEFIDRIFLMCRDWYGDDLMETYFAACVDDDMMNEAVDINLEPNKVIVKLFKILNTQKSNYNNKRDLQLAIKDYLPYFGIESDFAPYILELYLLNYRQDGDYSSLTKDNFVDPRKMKGKRTPNYNAKVYTKAQLPFEGSNLRGYWRTTMDGKIYIVESYGWYPVYIFKDGKWYETSDRYSSSTGKQMYASQPYRWNDTLESQVYLLSRQEMEMIERGATHEKVMELKRKAFRELAPSLISQKVSTAKSSSYGMEPKISIKFKISSVEDIDDKNVVNVDIQDVLKVVDGKQVPTPENYLKGEIPNVTPEKVEKQIEAKLRNNFQNYLGPKFSDKPEEENIVFRFNHLKK